MKTGRESLNPLLFMGVVLLLGAVAASCAIAKPPATITATPVPPKATPPLDPFAGVPGIVDPTNRGWPREVEGLNGRVTIRTRPERIITVSLGHDEMTYALVPAKRVVAVGAYTQKPEYSSVADLAKNAAVITRDPEQIVAQRPDIVVTDPYKGPEFLDALKRVGIPVVQTDLHNSPEGRIQDILLLGYIYGEEQRALVLAAEVQARYKALTAISQAKPANARPRVLSLNSYADKVYTAGRDSTEGSIIEAAGGRNAAAEAGLAHNPTVSLEGIIAMSPDLIIVPQPEKSAEAFLKELRSNPALAQIPAIKKGRTYSVHPKFFTTLSFWNIRGAEELAKLLWPDELGKVEFPPFSLPK